jgi:hypothetical protein
LVVSTGALVGGCGGGGSSRSGGTTTAPTVTPPHLEVNTNPAPWPRPDHIMERVAAAGLPGFTSEKLFFHVHAHLDVFVDGKAVPVAAGIGISDELGNAQEAGKSKCDRPCISPLHTHDDSGVLHVENDSDRQINLGQLFTEWGVRFSPDCVGAYCAPDKGPKVYVGGQQFTGDASTIVLKNFTEIALVIGTPPPTIPSAFPS